MMSENIFDLLARAITDPHAVAIETETGALIRYGDLVARSGQMANALVGLGLRPGDRLAAQIEKSPEAVLLYLATLRAGGVYLPLNTAYTPAEMAYFLADAQPCVFVCDPARIEALLPMASAAGARVVTLDAQGRGTLAEACDAAPADFATVPRDAGELAALLYTSGTTGRSKGAMLTHGNLSSNALALREIWHFVPEDVLIHALPVFHTHGLFVALNVALLSGASILLLAKFDPGRVLALMPRASVLMGVPTFYVRLLGESGLTPKVAASMRLFISGSAPLLEDTHRSWAARTGHAILERYGMTETNMNASNPYDGDRIPGSVGLPLPGVELRVTDPASGAQLPPDTIGMIEVRGPNVFKDYWQMPEKTVQEFRPDGFFITGDLGRIDARGYLHIVGRDKDLIITGGFNVYPKEVEAEIDAIPGVMESAVIGLAHPDFGEAVTAVVVPVEGAAADGPAILTALQTRLARFKQPKQVVFTDALPRNTMGKVQKNLLRDRFAGLYGA